MPEAICHQQHNYDEQDTDDQKVELAPGAAPDGFVGNDLRRTFDSFRGQLIGPGQNKRDREGKKRQDHNQSHRPGWNCKEGKELCRNLDEQPAHHAIGNRDLVDITPFELGEEVLGIHVVSPQISQIDADYNRAKRANGICDRTHEGLAQELQQKGSKLVTMGREHSHASRDFGRAFALGITLNLAYVAVQIAFGIRAHSLALLADAGHNFGDAFGLLLAWLATYLSRRQASERYTYGFRKTSILAALANAIFLLVTVGGITWEAIRRFSAHEAVAGKTVIWVAAAGVVINGGVALLFMSRREHDLNIRGAFLHMAADAAVSAGVVVAGCAILATGWTWLDPTVSLLINAVIVIGTWSLLCDSFNLSVDAVPAGIDSRAVERYLSTLPGVAGVHDLHIWAMSTTENALTAHVLKPDATIDDALLGEMKRELHRQFGIAHVTVQLECGDASHPCEQTPCCAT